MNHTVLVAELERIAALDPDGVLHNRAIVDAARDEASPLHEQFIWDDYEAAEIQRLHQARSLVRRLRVHLVNVKLPPRSLSVDIVRVENKPRSVRAFQVPRGTRGGYRSVTSIAADDDLAADMVQTLRAELVGVIRRSQDYLDAATAAGREEPLLQQVITECSDALNRAWPSIFDGGRGDAPEQRDVA
jgi:hypothetical protein